MLIVAFFLLTSAVYAQNRSDMVQGQNGEANKEAFPVMSESDKAVVIESIMFQQFEIGKIQPLPFSANCEVLMSWITPGRVFGVQFVSDTTHQLQIEYQTSLGPIGLVPLNSVRQAEQNRYVQYFSSTHRITAGTKSLLFKVTDLTNGGFVWASCFLRVEGVSIPEETQRAAKDSSVGPITYYDSFFFTIQLNMRHITTQTSNNALNTYRDKMIATGWQVQVLDYIAAVLTMRKGTQSVSVQVRLLDTDKWAIVGFNY
jgi:hypothetical protein